VTTLAVSGTDVFAGTGRGIYLSTNSGTSWTQVNSGLTDTNITCLTASGTNLFAGTNNGVWRRPLSEMVTSADPVATEWPHGYLLQQNYPNPFNPSTTITYELPKSSDVRLIVYDLLGREVSVLVNERMHAGTHEVQVDARNLASGVYVYHLQAGAFMSTKRMLILK
jgi:hypothetical protein